MPDAALALIARSAAAPTATPVSTLDQLASATGGAITVQDVLQLLGAVEDEVLFRLCDLVVDGETRRGAALPRGAVGAGPGSRPARHRPARAPAAPAARPAHGRGARLAAGDRRDARAAARAGEPAARRDGAPADRPAARRGRRHAPGRRPAAAARARARQGDAARRPTCRASRSRTASSGSSTWSAPRAESRESQRTWFANRHQVRSRFGAEPPSSRAAGRARAAPGGVAANDPAGGRAALDPDRADARRSASGRARGRHADARVPADGRLPLCARRGSEERGACSATRSTR